MPRPRKRRETIYGEMYDPATDYDELPIPPSKTEDQLNALLEKVKSNTAFLKEIDEERLRAALSHFEIMEVKPQEFIYKQGQLGDKFYIVEEGSFKSFEREDMESETDVVPDDNLGAEKKTISGTDPCFGELALLYAVPRPNTVRAETEGKLWFITRKLYTRVVVKLAYKRRQRHMKFMKKCDLLKTVEPYEKVRLCDAFLEKKFKAGDVIMNEGDTPDGMYWVEKGKVEVIPKEGDSVTLGYGKYFGEMALLSHNKRNATVKAKEDCKLAFLETRAFERLMGKLHNLMLRKPDEYKKVLRIEFGEDNVSDIDSDLIR